jgi:hypothetical protein
MKKMWPFCLPFFLLIMASLAFKEYEYLKPHISIKRFRDEVMASAGNPKHMFTVDYC